MRQKTPSSPPGVFRRILKSDMSHFIPCTVLQRLKREYEVAVRVWGELEYSAAKETEFAQIALLQRKQYFLDARNAASKRLVDHKQICLICKNRPERDSHKSTVSPNA